jgi:uncharacterized protein
MRKIRKHVAYGLILASAGVLVTFAARAQTAVSPQSGDGRGPEIVVSGSAEVTVAPAKAKFTIEIKASAPTAAAASAENARLSRLVMEGLHATSIRADEIASSQLAVGAQWNYDESARRRKRSAYEATNDIQIQTDQLDKVATYIDAALSAGATGVTEAVYSEKDPAATRRRALSEAVAAARSDAEAMAQAGGGRLGELELLSTEQSESALAERMDRMFKKSVADDSTHVVAPQIRVRATVLARWQFLSAAPAK